MEFIVAPLVTFIVFAGIYSLFELFVRRKERMAIIEKLGDKLDASSLEGKFNFRMGVGHRFSCGALKAGCLMIGLGLGLLAGFVICSTNVPNYFTIGNHYFASEIVYGSCLFIFGGIGLITAFLLELKYSRKEKER